VAHLNLTKFDTKGFTETRISKFQFGVEMRIVVTELAALKMKWFR